MMHYVGISGGELPVERLDFGHGVEMRRTYAHLMSPCVMAFSPAEQGKPHPAPWRAAKGGFSFDITIELRIGDGYQRGGFNITETATLIVALARLGFTPYLAAPVTIDMPFSEAAQSKVEPTITPLEIQSHNFLKGNDRPEELSLDELNWLKDTWHPLTELVQTNPQFLAALLAWDSCRVRMRASQSMLTIWAALE
ncbi:hypothetical protein J2X65_003957 [Ancylobacter sp. 3268]|uniref:hypothetical protein n=1 Tax=Ancylobacter sp. 3268 TaxID=2817752 RepID=UPI002865CA9D|nr:hypothetical protein [Ancylobacter sp. 3268]MDR6954583.1 hypothetical protein [Ancylobacter sp. 3268]